ncbi:amidohydrolase, partial [Streptomyces sp. NPDC059556]
MTSSLSRRTVLAAAGAAGLVGVAGGPAAAGSRPRSAALVVHNARVFTGRSGGRPVEAVAVGRDGRILATGRGGELRRLVGRDTEVVDARGATVMSGIHDGHVHPLGAGSRSLRPSLEGAETTREELLAILTGFLKDSPGQEPDGWLRVGGLEPQRQRAQGGRPHPQRVAAQPPPPPGARGGGGRAH